MRFSGLSVSIATTFLLVLCGSLALGLFVTVVFWQRSLVQGEHDRTVVVLQQVEYLLRQRMADNEGERAAALGDVVRQVGGVVAGVAWYDGRDVVHYPEMLATGDVDSLVKAVRSSGLMQQEVTTYRGSVWAVLSPGKKTLIVTRPVVLAGARNGAVGAVVELLPVYRQFRGEVKLVVAYVLINIVIFSVIGLYRMRQLVVRPIERMARISESYTASSGAPFVSGDAGSEFGRLSMALNSMLMRIELDRDELRRTVASLASANEELRQMQQEVVQAEKCAAVGRLSAGLAHEIGNPLGIVQGYVELLRQPDLSSDDRRQFAERALVELQRIDQLIRRLLDFALTRPQRHEVFAVGDLLAELQEMFSAQARRAGIELVVDAAADCFVRGDRDGLKQVLLNCLINSFDAIESAGRGGAGRVVITVQSLESAERGRLVVITLRDNGTGIEADDPLILFEPFFTTKEPGKGTGLGLSVSHAIVEGHGGRMRLTGEKGCGATVTIELPEARHEAEERRGG